MQGSDFPSVVINNSWMCLLVVGRVEQIGYNSEASLYGVGEEETPRSVDLIVLLLDVLGDLLQDLPRGQKQKSNRFSISSQVTFSSLACPI